MMIAWAAGAAFALMAALVWATGLTAAVVAEEQTVADPLIASAKVSADLSTLTVSGLNLMSDGSTPSVSLALTALPVTAASATFGDRDASRDPGGRHLSAAADARRPAGGRLLRHRGRRCSSMAVAHPRRSMKAKYMRATGIATMLLLAGVSLYVAADDVRAQESSPGSVEGRFPFLPDCGSGPAAKKAPPKGSEQKPHKTVPKPSTTTSPGPGKVGAENRWLFLPDCGSGPASKKSAPANKKKPQS